MSSPEVMNHLSRQQDFDTVSVKLVRQGRPAMRPSECIERTVVCTYLAPNGDRCAAGHLFDLPDEKIAALPNVCASRFPVREILEYDGHDVSFAARLQSAHDVPARLYPKDHATWFEVWTRKMREIAAEYRLSTASLDEALEEKTRAT